MAYTFNGSTQYLRAQYSTNALASAWPVTLFARAKSTDMASVQIAVSYIYSNSPYNGLSLYLNGSAGGDPLGFSRFGATTIQSSVGYSSGVWMSWAGRSYSNTSFDIDAENTVTTGGVTSTAWQNTSDMQIGARLQPSLNSQITGDVACVAMWSAALTDAEIASLVAGFSPRRVRPQSLVFYAPLVRNLAVIQAAAAPTASLAGVASPAVSDHPRSYGI